MSSENDFKKEFLAILNQNPQQTFQKLLRVCRNEQFYYQYLMYFISRCIEEDRFEMRKSEIIKHFGEKEWRVDRARDVTMPFIIREKVGLPARNFFSIEWKNLVRVLSEKEIKLTSEEEIEKQTF